MIPRLSLSTLLELRAGVRRPAWDPRSLAIGIVHLGLGAFHRAHQAIYTDDAIDASGELDWGICGVSLRSPEVKHRLMPQDGLYVGVAKSQQGTECRVIGSVREALSLREDRDAVQARLAAPATRVITLTVTEKGYCHLPASGRLDVANAEIVHDLAHPGAPVSTIGLLVEALDARRRSHRQPVSVVSCDNLPHNGATLRAIVLEFARLRDEALGGWIDGRIAFPSTMVDRIVPATTEADLATVRASCGVEDAAPVVFEPFRQWVIEDAFASTRPAWDRVGAELVADVAPYEAMKLRLLNASHSALAYLGYLAGHEFIYQAIGVGHFARLVRGLMAEVAPTLAVPAGVDLGAYREALLERFANPALPHRTWQIAMDGSQKLPQRLLATVRENLAAGRPVGFAALAIAGWMRYVAGHDEHGRSIDVRDPLAARLAAACAGNAGDPRATAKALLGFTEIFGDDLRHAGGFVALVGDRLADLHARGADAVVREAAGENTPPA